VAPKESEKFASNRWIAKISTRKTQATTSHGIFIGFSLIHQLVISASYGPTSQVWPMGELWAGKLEGRNPRHEKNRDLWFRSRTSVLTQVRFGVNGGNLVSVSLPILP
jgi:hypothetical protein